MTAASLRLVVAESLACLPPFAQVTLFVKVPLEAWQYRLVWEEQLVDQAEQPVDTVDLVTLEMLDGGTQRWLERLDGGSRLYASWRGERQRRVGQHQRGKGPRPPGGLSKRGT